MCSLCNYLTLLKLQRKHSETIIDSNDDSTSSDDDSYENIDYVDASPPDDEIVGLEVVEIVYPEVGRIDDDILLTIKEIRFSVSVKTFRAYSSHEFHILCFSLESWEMRGLGEGSKAKTQILAILGRSVVVISHKLSNGRVGFQSKKSVVV
ncbi:hypothetical protein Tco_0902604 [Tanacetum coccineum]